MNTIVAMDEIHNGNRENPGLQLARVREKKGYSQEYVAGKLHLRVRLIELLEADDYQQMPEPVFIKGYIHAYAKLLGIPSQPLLETFNSLYSTEGKPEKALWQSKRESNKGERLVRWLTSLVAIAVIVAVSIWWQKNKDSQQLFTAKNTHTEALANKAETDIRLTDLSKMRSMLSTSPSPSGPATPLETHGG
ncbi:TPA: helix-turn-helix domain-containing protein [Legionella feeleii]|uniref:DNA-binding protein n=1 Tax=Legionella feeleii TaxID=453 RepID=A0A0W0TIL6_9GAMM|nr:helix-turn-helix domain-containing protein [Legionella feeleii]KTC95430.1 DNA-binding protein [Legionella feeleii]SPX60013.1 DNA-binding protein [Legionella feeleii]STX38485.1 DNA-binding protein [Legionella feeleii]